MGTHAQLGVRKQDGSITGCYIHYDGYPDHMIPAIKNYVDRFTTSGLVLLIASAQAGGGMRFFNARSDGGSSSGERTTELFEDEKYVIDESNWRDNDFSSSYHYLVDYVTGEIKKWSKQ